MKNISVDIVIPVYNEGHCLKNNITALRNYLAANTSYAWTIIIADNASVDSTAHIAKELTAADGKISYIYFPQKGRGWALKNTFSQSSADIVCYMDVDLSTNLRYFTLLIEGIVCGYDIAIGSRLMQASRVRRRLFRETVSRCYNLLIKLLFFNCFSDAQCGFKAIKTDVAKKLIPLIENNNWFFDTELLLLAEHNHYRIFEIPVEWIQDIKTKVKIGKTIIEDLMGLLRIRFSIHKSYVKTQDRI